MSGGTAGAIALTSRAKMKNCSSSVDVEISVYLFFPKQRVTLSSFPFRPRRWCGESLNRCGFFRNHGYAPTLNACDPLIDEDALPVLVSDLNHGSTDADVFSVCPSLVTIYSAAVKQ